MHPDPCLSDPFSTTGTSRFLDIFGKELRNGCALHNAAHVLINKVPHDHQLNQLHDEDPIPHKVLVAVAELRMRRSTKNERNQLIISRETQWRRRVVDQFSLELGRSFYALYKRPPSIDSGKLSTPRKSSNFRVGDGH